MGRQQEKDYDLRLLREARDSMHMTPLQMRRVEEKIRMKRAEGKKKWSNPFSLNGYFSVLKGGAVAIGMVVLASTVAFGAGSLDDRNIFVSDSAEPIEIQTGCGSAVEYVLPETTTKQTTQTTTATTTTAATTTTSAYTTETTTVYSETEPAQAYTADTTEWTTAFEETQLLTETQALPETAVLQTTALHTSAQTTVKPEVTTTTTTAATTEPTRSTQTTTAAKPVSAAASGTGAAAEQVSLTSEAGLAAQTEPVQTNTDELAEPVHLIIPGGTAKPGEDLVLYAYFDTDITFRRVSFTIATWDPEAAWNVRLASDADLLEAHDNLTEATMYRSKLLRYEEELGIYNVISVTNSLSKFTFSLEAVSLAEEITGCYENAEIAAGVQIPIMTVHIPEDAAIGTEYLLNTYNCIVVPSGDKPSYMETCVLDTAQVDWFFVEEYDAHQFVSVLKDTCAVDYGKITVVE